MAGRGKGFRIFANIIMILLTISAVLPFVLLVVSSFTSDEVINKYLVNYTIADLMRKDAPGDDYII